MTEPDLRALFDNAGQPALDDEVRASSALYKGQRLLHARRVRRAVLGTATLGVVATSAGLLVLQLDRHAPSPVVLACSGSHRASAGHGTVTAGLDGVTLTVDNGTSGLAYVTSAGSTAVALPGRTHVTLPIRSGAKVSCGAGAPVQLTVETPEVRGQCEPVPPDPLTSFGAGAVSDLTLARITNVPAGAVLDSIEAFGSLRRVRLRADGKVVAEAVWQEMPVLGSWKLESLNRCG